MLCRNCGKELIGSPELCPSCGARLKGKALGQSPEIVFTTLGTTQFA